MGQSYEERFRIATDLSKLIDDSDKSFESIREAAIRLRVWEDRFPARAAAEILVANSAQGWEAIANYLAYRSVGDRDPIRSVLHPALKKAMNRDGIPRWVDRVARDYYEKPTPAAVDPAKVRSLVTPLRAEREVVDDRTVIFVPTTWEGWDAYQRIHGMMADIATHPDSEIQFDFSRCTFISPVGVAILGGVARSLQAQGKRIKFRWNSFAKLGVRKNLEQNGFAAVHGLRGAKAWQGNSVRYREDLKFDKHELVGYLTEEWLAEDWIHLSKELRSALVGTVAEIYLNAFEHSDSTVGVFTCGQHFPNKRRLSLTVADFGVGIPAKVRRHLRRQRLSGPDAMAWAFEPGNSTSPMEVGRGLGLELLRQFVHVNRGALQIYSGDGLAHLGTGLDRGHSGQPMFHELDQTGLAGTVVTIDINCDDLHYVMESELESNGPAGDYFS